MTTFRTLDRLSQCFKSVSGTYTTLIKVCFLISPFGSLSNCSICWVSPAGPAIACLRIFIFKTFEVSNLPTGQIIRPPGFSCLRRLSGILLAAAPTWIASYGPCSSQPNLPSPWIIFNFPSDKSLGSSEFMFSIESSTSFGWCSMPTTKPVLSADCACRNLEKQTVKKPLPLPTSRTYEHNFYYSSCKNYQQRWTYSSIWMELVLQNVERVRMHMRCANCRRISDWVGPINVRIRHLTVELAICFFHYLRDQRAFTGLLYDSIFYDEC